jgi:hypothetical protein
MGKKPVAPGGDNGPNTIFKVGQTAAIAVSSHAHDSAWYGLC